METPGAQTPVALTAPPATPSTLAAEGGGSAKRVYKDCSADNCVGVGDRKGGCEVVEEGKGRCGKEQHSGGMCKPHWSRSKGGCEVVEEGMGRCVKQQHSRGMCWAHVNGTCSYIIRSRNGLTCLTVAVPGGTNTKPLCERHGGGKRCGVALPDGSACRGSRTQGNGKCIGHEGWWPCKVKSCNNASAGWKRFCALHVNSTLWGCSCVQPNARCDEYCFPWGAARFCRGIQLPGGRAAMR